MEVERTFLTVGVYDNAIVRWFVGESGSNLDRFLCFLLPVSHVYLHESRVGQVFASYSQMSHLDPYEILNEHELAVIAGSFGSQAVLRTPAV